MGGLSRFDWEDCIGEEEGRFEREREAVGAKEEGGGAVGRSLVMVT